MELAAQKWWECGLTCEQSAADYHKVHGSRQTDNHNKETQYDKIKRAVQCNASEGRVWLATLNLEKIKIHLKIKLDEKAIR